MLTLAPICGGGLSGVRRRVFLGTTGGSADAQWITFGMRVQK
jgi:hypothetical protein